MQPEPLKELSENQMTPSGFTGALGPQTFEPEEDPLNAQLASDDACLSRSDRVHSQTSDCLDRCSEDLAGAYLKPEERDFDLVPADLIKVFDDITHFQIGVLKPPVDDTKGQAAFVPIFPFMYERLECGDIIMDREQNISFHVRPHSRYKTQ